MISIKNKGKTDEYVYDISLDGTVVNALGMNVAHNTDGFNFIMPSTFRYTKENPYIGQGLNRDVVSGKEYEGVVADVMEFDDLYMRDKMGLGIDEFCPATINFARKNYADILENGKTKKVGNTIKSRRMSGYIEKFLDSGIDMLLHGNGQDFIESYYRYIDMIYNYRIPLRDIASKGKIKKTLDEYVSDCQTTTKSGSKKSRQAWYELVLLNGIKVDLNDTIYYVNTGTKKSESDVKRITHQYVNYNDEIVELTNKIKKDILTKECEKLNIEYKALKTKQIKEMLKSFIVKEEDEIILNCKIVPTEIVEAEEDIITCEGLEYNVVKYIDQFNKRITPLLVCFSPEIRDKILVKTPDERKFFTEKQCELTSGFPFDEKDQDKYEVVMTPERKEIEYWVSVNEVPPFVKECGIDWDKLVSEYKETVNKENDAIFKDENEKYIKIIQNLSQDEIKEFDDDGKIPSSLLEIVHLDCDLKFRFNKLPDMCPTTGGYVYDDISYTDKSEEEFENYSSNSI